MWTLELKIRPSFTATQTIRICGGEPDNSSYMQVAEVWDILDDQPKQPLSHVFCDELLRDLSGIKISPVTPFVCGLDGTTYMLSFSSGFNVVEYSWWCKLPEAWLALQPIVDRILNLSESD